MKCYFESPIYKNGTRVGNFELTNSDSGPIEIGLVRCLKLSPVKQNILFEKKSLKNIKIDLRSLRALFKN